MRGFLYAHAVIKQAGTVFRPDPKKPRKKCNNIKYPLWTVYNRVIIQYMKITQNEIGKQFTLKGAPFHTYTLVWYSETQDRCGVVPSWADEPTEFTVRISSLRPLTVS